MKPILLFVWAERAVLGSAKTALKFKYEIEIGLQIPNTIQCIWHSISMTNERNNT